MSGPSLDDIAALSPQGSQSSPQRALSLPDIVGFRSDAEQRALGAGTRKRRRRKKPSRTLLPPQTNMASVLLQTLVTDAPYLPPVTLRVRRGHMDYVPPHGHGGKADSPSGSGHPGGSSPGQPQPQQLPNPWAAPQEQYDIPEGEFVLDDRVPLPEERTATPAASAPPPRALAHREVILTRAMRLKQGVEATLAHLRENPGDRVELVADVVKSAKKRARQQRRQRRHRDFVRKNASEDLVAEQQRRLQSWQAQHRTRMAESGRRRVAEARRKQLEKNEATTAARQQRRDDARADQDRRHRQRAWLLVLATCGGARLFRQNLTLCLLQARCGAVVSRAVVQWHRRLVLRRRLAVKADGVVAWLRSVRAARLRGTFRSAWALLLRKIVSVQRLHRRNVAQRAAQIECLVQKWNVTDRRRVHMAVEALRVYCLDEINRDLRDKAKRRAAKKRHEENEQIARKRALALAVGPAVDKLQKEIAAAEDKRAAQARGKRRRAAPLVPELLSDTHLRRFVHYAPEATVRALAEEHLDAARAQWVLEKRAVYSSLFQHFKQVLGWEMKQADPTASRGAIQREAERMRDNGTLYYYLERTGYGLDGVDRMPALRYLDFDWSGVVESTVAEYVEGGGKTPAEMAPEGTVSHPVPSKARSSDYPSIPKIEQKRREAMERQKVRRSRK